MTTVTDVPGVVLARYIKVTAKGVKDILGALKWYFDDARSVTYTIKQHGFVVGVSHGGFVPFGLGRGPFQEDGTTDSVDAVAEAVQQWLDGLTRQQRQTMHYSANAGRSIAPATEVEGCCTIESGRPSGNWRTVVICPAWV